MDITEKKYDSTPDAMIHKANVKRHILRFCTNMLNRAETHDDSKLQSPEKELYDHYIPILRTAKYGTPEYNEIRKEMKENGWDHHAKSNPHHPEHFENGINDMTIEDFVEMLFDWIAASERSDTGFIEGLRQNANRYKIPTMLYNIMANTFKYYESLSPSATDDD